MVKNQGTKQREQRILGDCWQWEANGQCSKGDNCSFRPDINTRAQKMKQPNPSPSSFMQQNERNACVEISNKLVTNLNVNEQETSEMQFEEFALRLNASDFASRSKAKAKPRRREPVGSSQEQFLLGRELGPMSNQENIHSPNLKYQRN